ncbi:hypothetical protein HaLaN_05150, partial [Haematococcus lacustris]
MRRAPRARLYCA